MLCPRRQIKMTYYWLLCHQDNVFTTLERFIGSRPYIIIKGTLSNSEFRCETAALKFSMKNDDVAISQLKLPRARLDEVQRKGTF